LQELARTFFGELCLVEIQLPEAKGAGKKPAAAKKPFKMTELNLQALEVFGGAFVSPEKEEPE
jgi:hypothetical protein